MLLWVIFAVLTALVLFALLRPLARTRGGEGSRAAFDATVYRDQLAEVASDRERGLISEQDAEAARTEIARRLLATTDEARGSGATRMAPLSAVAIGLSVFLPLAALGVYLVYGSPQLPDKPLIARLQDPAADQSLDVLVAKVEARLREHPEEGEGWEVIAPVYLGAGRYADAAEAFRQSIRLLGDSPKRLSGYGQALVLANNGVVSEDARLALERSIALDPTLIEPRLMLIIAKEQDGQWAAAVEALRALLTNTPPNAPWRNLVEKRLAEDEAHLAGKGAGQPAPKPGPDQPVAEAPAGAAPQRGPTAKDVAAAENMSASDRQALIQRMVQGLADRLAQNGDDLAGWLKLVRAYTVLDRKDDAMKALARAKTTFSGNTQALQQLDALATELGLKS